MAQAGLSGTLKKRSPVEMGSEMSFLEDIVRVFDRVIHWTFILAGLLTILLILIVGYEVVMRYFFHVPVGWVVEVCEYLLLYLTFFGSAWLLREDRHIRVDILLASLNQRSRDFLNLINSVMGAVSCALITIFSSMNTWKHIDEGTLVIQTLSIRKWVLLWVIPFGFVLLLVQFIRTFFEQIQRLKKSNGNVAEDL